MRTRMHLAVIMLAAIQASFAVWPAVAQPIVYCAVPPVPPVGCAREKARCICDTNSRCQWYYDCTQNESAAGGSAYAYMYPYMTRMERGNATPLPAPGSRY